jgi:hypothetical protein
LRFAMLLPISLGFEKEPGRVRGPFPADSPGFVSYPRPGLHTSR